VADGKWISELQPEMPLLAAARHVLFVRFQVIRDCLPLVVHAADDDPEHVHQLRVGTRRADAAVRIFRTCMPDKVYKAARSKLRNIRRAAGSVRDWDVFLMELRNRLKDSEGEARPGLDLLIGYAIGQRTILLKQMHTTALDHLTDFEAFLSDTIASLRPSTDYGENASLLDLARPQLADLRQKLEQTASGNLNDYPQLHQVRIAGKRLRYAMEVFADCFPESFRDSLYPRIEEMQEMLGRANDSHMASDRLAALKGWFKTHWPEDWKRLQPGIEGLLRLHIRRLPQERRKFLQWWERWCKQGSEELLTTLYATPVG
jgi:CHAD domain-containing protein